MQEHRTTSMAGPDGVRYVPTESCDWQAFAATLDRGVLKRFDDIVYRLPPTASPHAVIVEIDALISGAGAAYEHVAWRTYVDHVLELASLRNSVRAWFFERGGYENANLNAYIANLVLDSRTRLMHVVPGAGPGERPPSRLDTAFMKAVPLLFLLVMLLALLSIATTMAFRDVFAERNATAAVALCLAVAMLAMGAIVSTLRDRNARRDETPVEIAPALATKPVERGMLVTRDSVCMADDVDAPHATRIVIDPDADALAVANAILRAGYLPSVAGGSTWSVSLDDTADADAAVFGHHLGMSFSHRVDGGSATLRSVGVTRIDLRYHRQDRPSDVIGGLAMARSRCPCDRPNGPAVTNRGRTGGDR